MQVMVLYNPIAGAGRSAIAAKDLVRELNRADHSARLLETRLQAPADWLDAALGGCDLLVVVGGDGAVRMASASAARTNTALYQYPCGTENLFAREFGMERSAQALLRAMGRFELRRVDLGEAAGRHFLLMASMGYDAAVVDDLARRRGRSISHLSYAGPMLRQFMCWRPPLVEVKIDGEPLVGGQSDWPTGARGWLVVANCRQYAARLNPAPAADMTDGLLDVVFVPMRTRFGLLPRMISYRRGHQARDTAAVRRRGQLVEIRVDPPQPWQLDGDPPDPVAGSPGLSRRVPELVDHIRISVQAGALPVLVP